MKISIGVSNRHLHLTKENFIKLFGDIKLEKKADLTQPGEFASTLTVTLSTEKGKLEKVRLIGPLREYTQVEISKTDAYKLGLNPPIRESGNVSGSESIRIIGPKGEIVIDEGCIISTRHIHATKEDLIKYNLDDNKKCLVKIDGVKGGIMNNVSIKCKDNYKFEMHIDTDDANAHLISSGYIAEIIGEDNESI